VQIARQHLLAGAAVSEQQHRGVGRGDLLDRTAHAAHGVAHADDAFQRHRAGTLAQPPVLLLELAMRSARRTTIESTLASSGLW